MTHDEAEKIATAAAFTLKPDLFEPVIRKLADNMYDKLLGDVQNYLIDNAQWNIREAIEAGWRQSRHFMNQLNEINKALGYHGADHAWRLARIAELRKATDCDPR